MEKWNERRIGAILSYVCIFLESITMLLYTPFLIRMIGQAEYGLYSLVSSAIGYLTVLDFGLGNALIVYTAKYNAQNRYDELKKIQGMFFLLFSIIGIITGVFGFILFLNVEDMFGNTMNSIEIYKAKIMMLILTFNLMISFPLGTYTSIIRAHEKFILIKILSILKTIFNPIIMIPLLLMGYKSIAMTLVLTFLNIFTLSVDYFYCRKKLRIKVKYCGFDYSVFKSIVGYSFFIFLGTIVDKINWSIDQFVLGAVSGTIEVSIYSIASRINTMFIYLSSALNGVLLPKISSMVAQNKDDRYLNDEFVKIGRIQYYVVFLLVSGICLFGKEFIILWVGQNFEVSYYVTLLLIVPLSFTMIQNLSISIAQAKGQYNFIAISTFIMSLFNLAISIYLAKMYGAVGSALGTAIALILCNVIILNFYYHKRLNLNVFEFWKNIIGMFIPFCGLDLLFFICSKVYPILGVISLCIYILLYTIMYCLFAYFLVMNEYEKSLVKNVMDKLKVLKRKLVKTK